MCSPRVSAPNLCMQIRCRNYVTLYGQYHFCGIQGPCPYLANKACHNPLLWWYAQPFTCIRSCLKCPAGHQRARAVKLLNKQRCGHCASCRDIDKVPHRRKGETMTRSMLNGLSLFATSLACSVQGKSSHQVAASGTTQDTAVADEHHSLPTCCSPLGLSGGSHGRSAFSLQPTSISSNLSPCLITSRYCFWVPRDGPVSSCSA